MHECRELLELEKFFNTTIKIKVLCYKSVSCLIFTYSFGDLKSNDNKAHLFCRGKEVRYFNDCNLGDNKMAVKKRKIARRCSNFIAIKNKFT